MDKLIDLLNNYIPYILLGLVGSVFLLLILLIVALIKIRKMKKSYNKLMRGSNAEDLETLIKSYIDRVEEANINSLRINEANEKIEKRLASCYQKFSMIRYSAFENVGGDLSFSVALLDGNNSGVILTGIYGRDFNAFYAKPVEKGISKYELSEEEIKVLKEAINK